MSEPLLTIAIPTRNRHAALETLLLTIRDALDCCDSSLAKIEIHDNASEPGLYDLISHAIYPHKATCFRKSTNIGPFRNQAECFSYSDTPYTWVLPDDEFLYKSAILIVLNAIQTTRPDWILLPMENETNNNVHFFNDMRMFFETSIKHTPTFILAAGCWGQNVWRTALFDFEMHERLTAQHWSYPHLPALLNCVQNVNVILPPSVITSQFPPLPPPDNHYSIHSSDHNWKLCIQWLNEKYGIDIPADLQSKLVSRKLLKQALLNPIKFLYAHGRSLIAPSRWPMILNRVRKIW